MITDEIARRHAMGTVESLRAVATELRKTVDALPLPSPHIIAEVYHGGYRTGVHNAADVLNAWADNIETAVKGQETP